MNGLNFWSLIRVMTKFKAPRPKDYYGYKEWLRQSRWRVKLKKEKV